MTDLEKVQTVAYALSHIKNQTPEIVLSAVKQDGLTLQFVKKQTPDLCLLAVKQNGNALYYVKEQTPEIVFCCCQAKWVCSLLC